MIHRRLAAKLLVCCVASWAVLCSALAVAEEGTFDSAGVRIRYLVEGEGEPVLLIHGFTASADMNWGAPGVISALAEDYRVIAIDNRGHGRSGKPHDPEQYGVEMVRDQIRLLDHLGIEKAHIIGYSMGGFITNKLVSMYPERVLSATLGGAGWRKDDDEVGTALTELAEALETGQGIRPLILRLYPPNAEPPSEEQLKTMNDLVMFFNDPKALAAVARGMQHLAITEDQVRAIRTPMLAVIGDLDTLKPGVDEMAEVLPALKVVVIEDADHMSAFNRPEFLQALREFLAEHARATATAPAGN